MFIFLQVWIINNTWFNFKRYWTQKKYAKIIRRCDIRLDRLVIELCLEPLVLCDLPDGLHEVLVLDILPLVPDGKEAGLGAHVPQVGAVEAVRQLDDGLVVDLAVLGDGARVNLQDLQPSLVVGQRDLNLPVEP